jgi:hypothetical protein
MEYGLFAKFDPDDRITICPHPLVYTSAMVERNLLRYAFLEPMLFLSTLFRKVASFGSPINEEYVYARLTNITI